MKWMKTQPHLLFVGIALFGFFVLGESLIYIRDQYASNWNNVRSIGITFSPGAMIFSLSLCIGLIYWLAFSTGRILHRHRTDIHLGVSVMSCILIIFHLIVDKFIYPGILEFPLLHALFFACASLFLGIQFLFLVNIITSKKESRLSKDAPGILDV